MIERLPLFPLNTVLLPGRVLPLHIFEPRYQLMLQRVLNGERRFGVLCIRDNSRDVDPTAEPYTVGTVAEITGVVPVEDGTTNISTTGRDRFRVTRWYRDLPYLSGDVEIMPDDYRPSEKLWELQREVEELGLRYVTTVLNLTLEQATQVRLPRDPLELSYKVASLFLELHLADVQELLETSPVERRLYGEILLLRRENAILQRMGELTATHGKRSPN